MDTKNTEEKAGPSLNERAEGPEKKPRKPMREYIGRRALLNTILAKSPAPKSGYSTKC
jgi:hypothetical protein